VQNLKPVHARHLDVEEYHVRRSFQNSLYRGYPVTAFSYDLHILELTQPVDDATSRQGLIVND
jgi:hypothetical protein